MYHLLSQYLVWVTIIFQLLEICYKVLTIQLYNFFVFDILKQIFDSFIYFRHHMWRREYEYIFRSRDQDCFPLTGLYE